ncbi:MAG: DUF6504 family protein [Chthoniobacterales bacterium]
MGISLISENIEPLEASFDATRMAMGEPGLPRKFRWRKEEHEVLEVLEHWKEYGDCTHGSGERYLRKHGFRVRTVDGLVLNIYFQRTFGRAKKNAARWWIHSLENEDSPSS